MDQNRQSDNGERGVKKAFTLIELLVVIAIIGILLGLIAGLASFAKRRAFEAKAQAELNYIADLVEKYRLSHGRYPEQGKLTDLYKDLPAGVDNEDPWGNEYQYEFSSSKPLMYKLYSYGKDGKKYISGNESMPADDIYPDR